MSAARKKVIVRMLTGELQRGYLPASGLSAEGQADLLLPDGRGSSFPLDGVKHVAYVRDFNLHDSDEPERMGPRSFASKPRGGGLWVRLVFADESTMEGLMHGGLPLLDSLLLDRGVFLDPPDKRGNTQRLFVPRTALAGFEILGIAGAASAGGRRAAPGPQRQGDLFAGAGEG